MNHFALASASTENADVYSDNNIFTIKGTKVYVPAFTLLAEDNQDFLAKRLKDQSIGMNIKQKSEN